MTEVSRIEKIIHPRNYDTSHIIKKSKTLFTNLSFMRSKVLIPLSKFEELLCNSFFSCSDCSASIPTRAAALFILYTPSSFSTFPSPLLMFTHKAVSVDEDEDLIAAK